jgi:hypothetical protein
LGEHSEKTKRAPYEREKPRLPESLVLFHLLAKPCLWESLLDPFLLSLDPLYLLAKSGLREILVHFHLSAKPCLRESLLVPFLLSTKPCLRERLLAPFLLSLVPLYLLVKPCLREGLVQENCSGRSFGLLF